MGSEDIVVADEGEKVRRYEVLQDYPLMGFTKGLTFNVEDDSVGKYQNFVDRGILKMVAFIPR
jgi:hypothetical protein